MTFSVPGYRTEQLLGRGSQAEVWSGQDLDTGERVALKRIVVDSAATAQAARFEAAVLAALDHPSLIALRAFVALDSEMVLVTELAEAGSLAELLRRRGRLSAAEVVASISPVAAALAHAHEAGILHADVSAANILFTAAGHPKLADLGVARLLASSDEAVGTPAYVDPVVAASGVPGAASDVFSLAAVALHALTGAGPWLTGDAPATAERVLAVAATGQIADLAGRLSGVDSQLAAALTRALDPEPHRRGTAVELALDLRAALQPTPVLAGGRILTPVGRHSVERRDRAAAALRADNDAQAAKSAQPAFRRPAATGPDGLPTGPDDQSGGGAAGLIGTGLVPADLTHVSRPQVRSSAPVPVPAGRRWWRPDRLVDSVRTGNRRPTLAVLAVVALLTLVLIGGLSGWWGHRPVWASASTDASGPAQATGPAQSSGPAQADPVAILDGLDRLRAQAYDLRRPDLLARVYRSPSLLAQDSAQLNRWVPAGCRLTGLHTSYRDVRTTAASTGRLQVTVTASLAAGSLDCAGTLRSRTPEVGPRELAVLLSDDGGGYRIDAERVAGPSGLSS